jgi:hypothetical protein
MATKPNGAEAADDSALSMLFNPDALKQLRGLSDAAKRDAALMGMLDEFRQALSDLVEHIEGNDPKATAAMLADAIKALKFPTPQVTVQAPQVTVQAPQVTLEATIPPAAPPVIMPIERSSLDEVITLRFKSQFGGPDKVVEVTRRLATKPKRIE